MKNLPRLRRAGGLTQYGLGRKARVGRSKISDVEIGRAQFTDAERSRVLAVLALNVRKTVEALNASLESDGAVEGNRSSRRACHEGPGSLVRLATLAKEKGHAIHDETAATQETIL